MAERDSSPSSPRRRSPWFPAAMILIAGVGAAGGWWWQSGRVAQSGGDTERRLAAAGIDPSQRAAIEGLVRDYILEHPEILPEAMERFEAKAAAQRVAGQRDRIETPFPGAVLGNPQGKITLVQFTDYACGYCRQSVAEVAALIAAHPDLRVVIRELPILSKGSEDAARTALAAARQGRYAAFHEAMFRAGAPNPAAVSAAASAAGVDAAAARSAGASADITAELAANHDLARSLRVTGTPAWVIGDQVLTGAVGREVLDRAIAAARKPA